MSNKKNQAPSPKPTAPAPQPQANAPTPNADPSLKAPENAPHESPTTGEMIPTSPHETAAPAPDTGAPDVNHDGVADKKPEAPATAGEQVKAAPAPKPTAKADAKDGDKKAPSAPSPKASENVTIKNLTQYNYHMGEVLLPAGGETDVNLALLDAKTRAKIEHGIKVGSFAKG